MSYLLGTLALCVLATLMPVGATRVPQYGLDSVEGFCEGWGELDQLSDITSQRLNGKYPYMGSMRAQVWMQDHFGFPINARPFSAIGTMEKIEIAEVLNEMVKRACEFEKPKAKMTTATTTTTTTAYRKGKVDATTVKEVAGIEKDVDQVLVKPVFAEASYPNLVSIINKKFASITLDIVINSNEIVTK